MINLKICILGSATGNIDEGMKNITFNIAHELSKTNNVLVLDPLNVSSFNFWIDLKNFDPQVIHYIPGRSIKSFILMRIISLYLRKAKIIMSASLTHLSNFSQNFISFFKPNLILVQSIETGRLFEARGLNIRYALLSGINIDKFHPVSKNEKLKLRNKYKVPTEKFVVLHVGHIQKGRNLQVFLQIQNNPDIQVIIVASTYNSFDNETYRAITKSNCLLILDYISNIEELYQLSDCYIFPTFNSSNCVDLPISVLEAMACNIPVISTKFGSLPGNFPDGSGLIYAEHEEQIFILLEEFRRGSINVTNIKDPRIYSWESIAKRLIDIYESVYSREKDV